MNKSLLTLGLLGLAGSSFGQALVGPGPWTEVNNDVTGGNVATPATYVIDQLVTLSPTFTWGIAYDGTSTVASPPRNNSVRAIDAAGTIFDFNSIAVTTGYQPSNISVPFGVTNNTTAFCGQYATGATNGGGGEVIRSLDGGLNWAKITGAGQFAQPAGFCNWAYAFNANEVVTGGDPNPLPAGGGAGQFEFWWSNNASNASASSVTWNRAVTPAPLDAEEYALVNSYTAVGDTIWCGTSHAPGGVDGPARVMRSVDKGHTWTVANTPMTGTVANLAFKDSQHGVAYSLNTTGINGLMTTSDGGLTWTMQVLPDPTTADSVRGKFYFGGIAAVPHVGFISYGPAVPSVTLPSNYGVSYSSNGVGKSWTDIEKGVPSPSAGGYIVTSYDAASFLRSGVNGYTGYLGGLTSRASLTDPTGGSGGIYKVNSGAVLGTKRSAALQRNLTVSPNPSRNGIFQLQLADGIKTGTVVTVFDALGRQVFTRDLNATAVASKQVSVDLSNQKTGVYTLRLTTAAGIATQKLVIE